MNAKLGNTFRHEQHSWYQSPAKFPTTRQRSSSLHRIYFPINNSVRQTKDLSIWIANSEIWKCAPDSRRALSLTNSDRSECSRFENSTHKILSVGGAVNLTKTFNEPSTHRYGAGVSCHLFNIIWLSKFFLLCIRACSPIICAGRPSRKCDVKRNSCLAHLRECASRGKTPCWRACRL